MNGPVFEVYESSEDADLLGQSSAWRWRLKGENGEIIASGEAYTRKADAIRGAETAKRLMTTAEIVDA